MKAWISNNKLIMRNGKVLVCDECPCELTGTGTPVAITQNNPLRFGAGAGGPSNTGWLTTTDWSGDTGGEWAFSNHTNAEDIDASYATAAVGPMLGPESTEALVGETWGASIPGGSTILGFEVEVTRHRVQNVGSPIAKDKSLILTIGGTPGDDKADTVTEWGGTDDTIVYGSSSDLWGLTPSVTDVNNNMRIDFSVDVEDFGEELDVKVDAIRIRVHYS